MTQCNPSLHVLLFHQREPYYIANAWSIGQQQRSNALRIGHVTRMVHSQPIPAQTPPLASIINLFIENIYILWYNFFQSDKIVILFMNKERSIPSRVHKALQGTPPTTRCAFHHHGGTTIRPNQLLQTALYYSALLSNHEALIDLDSINQRLDYCLTRIAMSVQRELDVGTLMKTPQGIQPSDKHDFLSTLARQIKRVAYTILDVLAKFFKDPTPAPLDEILSSVFSDQYTDRPYYVRQAEKLRLLLSKRYVFTCTIPEILQTAKDLQGWSTKNLSHMQYREQDTAPDGNAQRLTNCQQFVTNVLDNVVNNPFYVDQLVSNLSSLSHATENCITLKLAEEQQLIIDKAVQDVHVQLPTPVAEPTPVAYTSNRFFFGGIPRIFALTRNK